uniref:Uncharacterized protein n=1 Tax=Anopheles melas TaxID=34690 RepID=A0A182UI18_9DIPT
MLSPSDGTGDGALMSGDGIGLGKLTILKMRKILCFTFSSRTSVVAFCRSRSRFSNEATSNSPELPPPLLLLLRPVDVVVVVVVVFVDILPLLLLLLLLLLLTSLPSTTQHTITRCVLLGKRALPWQESSSV